MPPVITSSPSTPLPQPLPSPASAFQEWGGGWGAGSQELLLASFAFAPAVPLLGVCSPLFCSWPAPVYSFSLSPAVPSRASGPSLSNRVGGHTFPTPQFLASLHRHDKVASHPLPYSVRTYVSNGFPWETRASESGCSFLTVSIALAPTTKSGT